MWQFIIQSYSVFLNYAVFTDFENKALVMFLYVIMNTFLLPEYLLSWLNWSQSRLYIIFMDLKEAEG